MDLNFRAVSAWLALSVFCIGERPQTASAPAPVLEADVCEMIHYSGEAAQLHYPNEYYDCAAHSRYFKEAAVFGKRPAKA